MKSIDEIKSISKTYSSGPIVKAALEDAIKWAEAYREVAIQRAKDQSHETRELESDIPGKIDAEATRILEEKS